MSDRSYPSVTRRPKPSLPINPSCVEGSKRFRHEPEWQKNGQSWSCSFCGSMSIEELQECFEAVPPLMFELNDRHDKVYVNRYHHAGDCPVPYTETNEHGGSFTMAPCSCSIKQGGGPIKFMMPHLWDIEDEAERQAPYRHLMAECVRSHETFMANIERYRRGEIDLSQVQDA